MIKREADRTDKHLFDANAGKWVGSAMPVALKPQKIGSRFFHDILCILDLDKQGGKFYR
jgi:hypothetical protein